MDTYFSSFPQIIIAVIETFVWRHFCVYIFSTDLLNLHQFIFVYFYCLDWDKNACPIFLILCFIFTVIKITDHVEDGENSVTFYSKISNINENFHLKKKLNQIHQKNNRHTLVKEYNFKSYNQYLMILNKTKTHNSYNNEQTRSQFSNDILVKHHTTLRYNPQCYRNNQSFTTRQPSLALDRYSKSFCS